MWALESLSTWNYITPEKGAISHSPALHRRLSCLYQNLPTLYLISVRERKAGNGGAKARCEADIPDILFPAVLDEVLVYFECELVLKTDGSGARRVLTLELVLANVDEARGLNDVGGEVVNHNKRRTWLPRGGGR